VLDSNKKCGIKLTNQARAHIGGIGHDLHEIETLITLENEGLGLIAFNDSYFNR